MEPDFGPTGRDCRRKRKRDHQRQTAARQGDTTTGGALIEGSPNVFINGKPATVIGDRNGCGGAIVSGGHGVFINGKPMARQGDQTSECAK